MNAFSSSSEDSDQTYEDELHLGKLMNNGIILERLDKNSMKNLKKNLKKALKKALKRILKR